MSSRLVKVRIFLSAVLVFFSASSHAAGLPSDLLNAPIKLITGEQVSLAEYKGNKPVYLKFWATWCQPCRKQMPHFEHVQKRYGDKIMVVGINLGLNDNLEAVKNTMKEFGLTMPMAIDENGDLAQKFRLIGTPYHLLFDKNMNLVHKGHESDESIDNKLELLSQNDATGSILDAEVLAETEEDISINTSDGKLHALFFTATWCDWYLKDSRPSVSAECVKAQKAVNDLSAQYPGVAWLGVASRLWSGDKDLLEYTKKYSVKHPIKIDKSNRLFHKYGVSELPKLLLIKNGKVLEVIADFNDSAKISEQLSRFQSTD